MRGQLKINGQALSRAFVKRQFSHKVSDVIESIGEKRLQDLIMHGEDISTLLSAEMLSNVKQQAIKYRWLGDIISDEEFMGMLPSWSLSIIKEHGEAGTVWLRQQIQLLRAVVQGTTLLVPRKRGSSNG